MILSVFIVPIVSNLCHSEQISISSFKGLNSNENSVIIDPSYAQDTLNVDISPGGKSVKKRPGFGLYKTLYSSQLSGLHGGYHFFDSTGNDVQLWASSTSVYGIVADATPAQLVSSATLNSTLDCVDIQGSAYCATSSRDFLLQTNGATKTWYTTALGTMVEATPDRLVVSGVAGSLSTLYVSGSNAFTTFTAGPLATDPFTEVIAAPGSKLTHTRWGCGKLLWWKDQSFGWFSFEDQYTAQLKIVSDTIGTFDNTSAIDPGGNVWFRGQDGHIWRYDCSGLIKESIEITPNVQASGRRTSNSWTQTSQSDWQAGSIVPTGQLSTTISAGDVVPSSFTVTENSASSGWSSGTSSNLAIGTSSITLSINNLGNVTNNDFETCPGGTPSSWGASSWGCTASTPVTCTINPKSGSFFANLNGVTASETQTFEVIDLNNTILQSQAISNTYDCVWRTLTVTPSSSNIGKRVKFRINTSPNGYTLPTSSSYIWGGPITFWVAQASLAGPSYYFGFDLVTLGSSTVGSGSYTSKIYDTGITSSTFQLQASWTVNTATPSFALLTSTANPSNNWVSTLASTGTNSVGNRYVKYVSTISASGVDALSSITSVTAFSRSSGTFYSTWKNAATWSAWGTFNPTKSDGDGSHTFYVRSSTSPQSVLNSTVAWVAQTADSLVATSTPGIYFQIRDDFTIGAATNTPTLNSFLVNWFEGTATDQAYLLYFDNSIWASVAYGVGVSSNTYIFKRDLINDGWVLYSFGTGGMLVQNNHLFFGGVPATAQVFQFDSGNSDNGTAIPAYWKTKDFTGADPFLEVALGQIDTFTRKDQGSTLAVAYTLNTSTTSVGYNISLSSTTQSIVQSRKLLPAGKSGYTFNVRYGDSSTSSEWEILGFRIGFTPQTYRPSP